MKRWIMKWVSLILIGTLIYLAHERRPLLAAHQAFLYKTAANQELDAEALASPAWEKLKLRDFFIATATQDTEKNTLISFGFGNYFKVIDSEWVKRSQMTEPR